MDSSTGKASLSSTKPPMHITRNTSVDSASRPKSVAFTERISEEKKVSSPTTPQASGGSASTFTSSNAASQQPLEQPPQSPSDSASRHVRNASNTSGISFADSLGTGVGYSSITGGGSLNLSPDSRASRPAPNTLSDLVEQVKSPYENEAELAILSVIEDTEKRHALSGMKKDRDNILSQVPAKSMGLFMRPDEQQPDELPQVFSLRSIDERSHLPPPTTESISSKTRFTNAIQRVINAQGNGSIRTRLGTEGTLGSVRSGEASVIYKTDAETHEKIPTSIPVSLQRIPSTVPATPPRSVTYSSPNRLTRSPPKLFAIADQLIGMERQGVERQKTFRNLTRTDFSAITKNDYSSLPQTSENIDPESLIPEGQGFDDENLALTTSQKASNRGSLLRCCFPCVGLYRFRKDQRRTIKTYLKVWLIFFIITFGIAALLAEVDAIGNPTFGDSNESIAWVFLFVIRQSVTFFLAKFSQLFIIDYIAMETSLAVRFLGRIITLLIILSKGWPSLVSLWGIWNLLLVYGTGKFAKQWCFKLNIKMCNMDTGITYAPLYRNILITMVLLGFVVMFKRLFVSLLLGKKKYVTYGPKMEKLMKKVLLIAEIAMLAEEIEFMAKNQRNNEALLLSTKKKAPARGWLFENYKAGTDGLVQDDDDDDEDSITDYSGARKNSDVYEFPGDDETVGNVDKNGETDNDGIDDVKENEVTAQKGNIFQFYNPFKKDKAKKEIKSMIKTSKTQEIEKLLGEWEEPEVYRKAQWEDTSVHAILQFRESLKYLDGDYPLSTVFGLADSRKSACHSAEKVYERLLMKTPDAECINFETISMLAVGPDGKLDKEKARALIRLLRPDREGNLPMLEFVKSCDKIYRRARIFRATTLASAQLDDAFEQIINILFYIVVSIVIVVSIGLKTDGIFAFSGALLSLSFMFGGSTSRYLEGVLLVLARQPYDVGDRIAISNPQNDTSCDGSTTWYVENISLFQTTVRMAATNEVATYSNSSLSHCRIINAARSPKAVTYVYLKFGIDVPYSKVMIFKDVVEKFVKERPREFIKINGFRAVGVEADLGYIKYVICLQHVESWQNIGEVLNAKASVASFCLEVQKKMDMRYVAPPMPVDLSIVGTHKEMMSEFENIMGRDLNSTGSPLTRGDGEEGSVKIPPIIPPPGHNREMSSLGYENLSNMFAHK
ncbi:hypothetical protein CTEN210_14636 [Chaetoceros tenuissimus]|uniref:Mechanosensitive ion channel MscS domain-containing protein n=1 Tax=Chaetoceros tenuissimus TaxID=426638 RepID=A0AAD3HC46_9STRA|nr:hypothetical protein CTEN210_14636 [Chaetoceros tenuissimus]